MNEVNNEKCPFWKKFFLFSDDFGQSLFVIAACVAIV
jgi:hypothetical protein